ncbi:uncharacterized protein K460DRAFT_281809, partial [Cucurbitaria berberidis CBS 394.84]
NLVQDMITTLPKLRVLRLTHAPFFSREPWNCEEDDQKRQWRHGQVATEMMRYLAAKKSPIQVLAFSPSATKFTSPGSLDENRHLGPNYYYVRGETTVTPGGGYKPSQVVAVPASRDLSARYAGESPILAPQARAPQI